MKHISQHNPPRALQDWKQRETIAANRHYDGSLPTEVKDAIRDCRVEDQGGLCPYTLREIPELVKGQWDAHVEHIVPRSESRESGDLDQTVDYRNMIACVNRMANLPYGASVRGKRTLPVTPMHPQCERRFRFSLTAEICPTSADDAEAEKTIEMLRLNHTSLIDLRRDAMAARGLAIRRTDNPSRRKLNIHNKMLGPDAARRLADNILRPNAEGKFAAFCVAIAHAAIEHAERIEKIARNRKFAGQKSNKRC